MNRLVVVGAIVGILIGVLVGFLWWGMPTQTAHGELDAARKRADGLEQQLDAARTDARGLETRLKETQDRLAAAEKDLTSVKEMNLKLQRLVGRGKK